MTAATSAFTFQRRCSMLAGRLKSLLGCRLSLESYRPVVRQVAASLNEALEEFGGTEAADEVYHAEYFAAFDALAVLNNSFRTYPLQRHEIERAHELLFTAAEGVSA